MAAKKPSLTSRQEQVLELKKEGLSNAAIARRISCGETTVQKETVLLRDLNLLDEIPATNPKGFGANPSITVSEDKATIVTPINGTDRSEAEQALRDNGYDPDDYDARSVKVNGWDMPSAEGGVERMTQFSVSFQKRKEAILKPLLEIAGQKLVLRGSRPKARKNQDGSQLVVIAADNHCPNHDEDLHQVFLSFLKATKPDRFVHLGDLVDDNESSTYLKSDPRWVSSCAEDITVARKVLADYTLALPESTEKQLIIGNHEARLRKVLLNNYQGLDALHLDGPYPHLHWATLLGLPDLGWEYVGSPDGADYPYAEIDLAPAPLVCIHGEKALGGAGNSVRKQMDERAKSYIQGHTHKAGHVSIAKGDMLLDGAEIPALAQRNLGYRKEPDHHAGFATVQIWPDGKYQIDIAKWSDGSLLWRGQRWDFVTT